MTSIRHIPSLKDLTPDEIREILDKAAEIKANPTAFDTALHGKSLAMLFQKTSTRTRVSFEVGMTQLGGHGLYIDWETSNFMLSGIEHESAYLSRNVDCIMARLLHHTDLLRIIAGSRVPVINGCCEKFHPCQALTDVMSIREHWAGDLADVHLVYIGVQNNVSNSLTLICDKLGMRLTLATPDDAGNGESQDARVQDIIATSKRIRHVAEPKAAVQNADFVYTDTWIDMQYFNHPDHSDEKAATLEKMLPYQVNAALIDGIDCKVMHDMPIHDGFEISAAMTRDPRAIIYEQAANRLHAQKGLLWWLLARSGAIGQ